MKTGRVGQPGTDFDRGWLLGHFAPASSPFHSEAFEVKWGKHPAGQQKAYPALNQAARTLSILVYGKFEIQVNDKLVVLEQEGDFLYVEPGEVHTALAVMDSLIITVRWPSVPGDQIPAELPPLSKQGDLGTI